MKIKKLFITLFAVVMALGMLCTVVACGGDGDKDPDEKSPENTKSYQLTGEFREDLQILGKGFDFMLDLNVDGTAVLARYNPFSYDANDVATNTGYVAKYMEGNWIATKNDGNDCLKIELAVKNDDNTKSDEVTAYAYIVAGGMYSFDLTFPVMPGAGFSKNVTLSGDESKTYADGNAFIQAKKMTFKAPVHAATFVSKNEGNVNATAYVAADGKIYLYAGYSEMAKGTYTNKDNAMEIKIGSSAPIIVTVDENKGTFAWTHDLGPYGSTNYTFVCDNFAQVPVVEKPDFETVTYKGTAGGVAYTINLTSETECEYIHDGYVSYGLSGFECTYTINATTKVITLAIKKAPTDAYVLEVWNGMKDIVWTLREADHSMSGYIPAAGEFTPMKFTGNTGGYDYSINLTSETECEYANVTWAEYGLPAFGCTYTIDRTTWVITIIINELPTDGSVLQVWNDMKDIVWTLDTVNNTMTGQAP